MTNVAPTACISIRSSRTRFTDLTLVVKLINVVLTGIRWRQVDRVTAFYSTCKRSDRRGLGALHAPRFVQKLCGRCEPVFAVYAIPASTSVQLSPRYARRYDPCLLWQQNLRYLLQSVELGARNQTLNSKRGKFKTHAECVNSSK